ncbi:BON domain-containing protein [Iodobacter sp. CM08]|uniref:BON domain-containing protein n=1 Tax=Iodobacter sp. CM08 TaxID=3085902 RepID=UPI002982B0D2|nr:BON domain-containing protein [Iodobacter sp. CM08]MDW5419145.1 BON domain-containing protein [Iodobacter sp. CM08]
MHSHAHKLLIASSLAAALTVFSGPLAAASIPQEISDAKQETQIWTTYALSPYLRASDLKVSVQNGKAVLSGKVDEEVNKDLAKQIALGVAGIKEVDNQIVVQADYAPAKEGASRSYGETIDDVNISAAIKSKLIWSKNTDGLSTTVETHAGKVRLAGTADNAKSKALASTLALNTRGVVSVDNQILINGAKTNIVNSVKSTASDADQSISDSWVSTKVISTFLYSRNVPSTDISVSTQHGVVTLSGKVASGAERALAIELAKNVRGVKRVEAKGLVSI